MHRINTFRQRLLHCAASPDLAAQRALTVRLLPEGRPESEDESLVHAALATGPLPLDVLIDRIAEQLVQVEIARGGWLTDVGVWGPATFRRDVTRLVGRLDGRMVHIERTPG